MDPRKKARGSRAYRYSGNLEPHPILDRLMAEGHIYVATDDEIVGRTQTGEVNLGNASNGDACEVYLRTHPTPDTW